MRIPNMIELGRRPEPVRYFWLLKLEGATYAGTTWRGLAKDLQRQRRILGFCVADAETERVHTVNPFKFLDDWRPHYFDPEWRYDPQHSSIDK